MGEGARWLVDVLSDTTVLEESSVMIEGILREVLRQRVPHGLGEVA